MTAIGTWLSGLGHRPAVLPGYHQEVSPLRKLVSKSLFYSVVVIAGLFYGLCVVLLPPLLLLYFSFPILLLMLVALWALPDAQRGPLGWVALCFFAFGAVVMLWPDYMAFQIPGFAWISFRRIWAWGLAAGLLLCLAMSSGVRHDLATRMRMTKPFWIMAGIYFALQWLTLPMSHNVVSSFNISLNQQFVWGGPLIAAMLLFDQHKNLKRWERLVLIGAAINCIIAGLEFQNRQLLWIGHIPALLTVQDEVLQRILDGVIRDGQYRATSVFTVSLCLAEFLTIAVPFALSRAFVSRSVGRMFFWAMFDLVLLGAIILTGSRLGIIGWLIGHSVFMLLWGTKRWMTKARDLIGPAISLTYPVGAAVFVVMMFTVPAVHNRTIGGGSTGFSNESRQIQFNMFWPKLFRNPLGNGTGRSGEVLDYHTPGGMITVDSYVISVGLDYGVLGMVCFFGMFFYTFWLATQAYLYSDKKEAELAAPVACVIAILCFVRTVLSQLDNLPLYYVMFGMALAIYARTLGPERSAARSKSSVSGADLAGTRLVPAE